MGCVLPEGGTHALVRTLVKLLGRTGRRNPSFNTRQIGRCHQERKGHIHRIQMETMSTRTTTWSSPMLMSTIPTRNSTRIPRVHKREPKKLEKMDWSMSLFVLYFGTDIEYNDVAHHTSCSDLDTRDCSMTSSKEATFLTTSVCTSRSNCDRQESRSRRMQRCIRHLLQYSPWASRC